MEFKDILTGIENYVSNKKDKLTKEEIELIYSITIYKILNTDNLKNSFWDIYINRDAGENNSLYSTKLIDGTLYSLFNKNISNQFFVKLLNEEDNLFIKDFKQNLIDSSTFSELSSHYNFDEISKLKTLLHFNDDIYVALLNYVDYEKDVSFGLYKDRKNNLISVLKMAGKNNSFSNIPDILWDIDLEDQKITLDNFHSVLDQESQKKIARLAGFNILDFSVDELKEFIDEDFLNNNPLGILLDSNSTVELHSRFLQLYAFDSFKNFYSNLCDLQLNENTLEEELANNINVLNAVTTIIMNLENKYPELNQTIENINIIEISEIPTLKTANLIDSFNVFEANDLIYNGDTSSYFNYFNYCASDTFNSFSKKVIENDFEEIPSLVTFNNGFITKGFIEIVKLIYKDHKNTNNNFLNINNIMFSDDLEQTKIKEMINTLFEIAEHESLIIYVRYMGKHLSKSEKIFMSLYEEIRLQYPNVVSETYIEPLNAVNSFLGKKGNTYKDDLLIQKTLNNKIKDLLLTDIKSDLDLDHFLENEFNKIKDDKKLKMTL